MDINDAADQLAGGPQEFIDTAEYIVENASDSPQRRLALVTLADALVQFQNAQLADLPPAAADPAAHAAAVAADKSAKRSPRA